MSAIYALLIGVDFYYEYPLPDGSYYPTLGGCVRDIRHVEAYLTDPARLNIPRQNILMLTASDAHGEHPVEPPQQWPTYENMVAQFKALTTQAQPGDQVYIHYSGHGGRATTIFADLKGDSGVDEALVPLDIGDPQARYLRDVELYYLIDDMVQKGLRVIVVFDSCHSGGATRGLGGARKRGIGIVDTTVFPTDSLVAPPAMLADAWQHGAEGRTRDAKPASGWLLEPKGYTLFAACRANESAFEYPFSGTESNGALTYWLLDTLRQVGPDTTYKMLHDRILAKVHGQFEQQTPLLQGEGEIRIFGSDRIPSFYAIPLLQVDNEGKRVRLNAGEVHGITLGTHFAIYPSGTSDFGAGDSGAAAKPIAEVEVSHVNEVDCWANIVAQSGQDTLEEGAQALLLQSTNLRVRRDVALLVDDPALKQQIEAAISAQGKGFVTIATTGKCDFQVALREQNERGQSEFELWDAAGTPIPNLHPALSVSEPDATARLVQRLVHLAKYYSVRDLSAPDPTVASKLEVTLTSLSSNAEKDAGGAPVYKPNDKIKMVVKNNQTPGEADDPARILNITVLNLAPDWSITQIFPEGAALFEPLDPAQTFEFEFEAFLPDGSLERLDTLKVFATQATTNFRWLQLPPLDQPPAGDAHQRAAITDPLEQLFASITGESIATRDLRVTSSPQSHGWTTAQVELRVQG
jgi:hypothetical protein